MIKLARIARREGVRYLTVYALSTENLSRPEDELGGLYSLFRKYFTKNVKELVESGAAVRILGDISVFPEDLQKLIEDGVNSSPEDADYVVSIALNYGARAEIVRAVNEAVARGEKISQDGFSSLLYTAEMPDPDLIIRTGGEKRLSNFMTYQAAYAELYFTDVLFPDFDEAEFLKALDDYSHRVRRFGKI